MKLSKKQIDEVLVNHNQVIADVEYMQLIRTQLLQKANKGECGEEISEALQKLQEAKARFETLINETLQKDKLYKECAERAFIQGARSVDRTFFKNETFSKFAETQKNRCFSTLSGLESVLLSVVNDHHKVSEEHRKQKKERSSLKDKIEMARRRLAELEKEMQEAEE